MILPIVPFETTGEEVAELVRSLALEAALQRLLRQRNALPHSLCTFLVPRRAYEIARFDARDGELFLRVNM